MTDLGIWVMEDLVKREGLQKWRRPRETEDLGKRKIWGNGGSGEMEDLRKWKIWGNGGPRK
jgi:hypothetical protein